MHTEEKNIPDQKTQSSLAKQNTNSKPGIDMGVLIFQTSLILYRSIFT